MLFRSNESESINWSEASVDDVVAYVTRLRSQLRTALLTARSAESQNPHVQQMFLQIQRQAEETGQSVEVVKRGVLAELDEETNMEAFRAQV